MNQEENKAKWNHNLNGYNPSGLTPNKTLLEHIHDIEAKIIELEKKTGTPIFIKDLLQNRIDFKSDPQAQLDNHATSIAGNIEGIAHLNEFVQDNTGNIAILSADKQNFATDKHVGNLNVGTMQEFRDYFYELRKSPTRSYQYEISDSVNIDLMDILGWPNGNGKSAFIYVNLPYSEAGGFEIDITYMERNGDNIYKRTMASTLNANWKDSGWVQYVSKTELTTLASKVETNTTEIGKKATGKIIDINKGQTLNLNFFFFNIGMAGGSLQIKSDNDIIKTVTGTVFLFGYSTNTHGVIVINNGTTTETLNCPKLSITATSSFYGRVQMFNI